MLRHGGGVERERTVLRGGDGLCAHGSLRAQRVAEINVVDVAVLIHPLQTARMSGQYADLHDAGVPCAATATLQPDGGETDVEVGVVLLVGYQVHVEVVLLHELAGTDDVDGGGGGLRVIAVVAVPGVLPVLQQVAGTLQFLARLGGWLSSNGYQSLFEQLLLYGVADVLLCLQFLYVSPQDFASQLELDERAVGESVHIAHTKPAGQVGDISKGAAV